MSRMWSPTEKFNEAFEKLSEDDKSAAHRRMMSSISINIIQREDGSCVLADVDTPVDMWRDDTTGEYKFRSGEDQVFIGAPVKPAFFMGVATSAKPQPLFVNEEPFESNHDGFVRLWSRASSAIKSLAREELRGLERIVMIEIDGIVISTVRPVHEVADHNGIYWRDERGNRVFVAQSAPLEEDGVGIHAPEPQAQPEPETISPQIPQLIVHPSQLKTKAVYGLAIGKLAMALVEHGHVWTDEERALYDEALDRLQPRMLAKSTPLTEHEKSRACTERDFEV